MLHFHLSALVLAKKGVILIVYTDFGFPLIASVYYFVVAFLFRFAFFAQKNYSYRPYTLYMVLNSVGD